MKTIYKYPLATDRELLYLPIGAQILSAKPQRGQTVIYALIDKLAKGVEAYEFLCVITGGDATNLSDYTYMDTLLFSSNQTYVEHVFYRKVN